MARATIQGKVAARMSPQPEFSRFVLNARSVCEENQRGAGTQSTLKAFCVHTQRRYGMTKFLRFTTVAFIGAAACLTAASTTPAAAAAEQAGVTQELSAVCRTVTTYRWSNGRRIAVRRSSCSPGYVRPGYAHPYASAHCRYVLRTRWSNGHRVTSRVRTCG
jgi:hypothetical protein